MNCAMPRAPFGLTAFGLKALSFQISLAKNDSGNARRRDSREMTWHTLSARCWTVFSTGGGEAFAAGSKQMNAAATAAAARAIRMPLLKEVISRWLLSCCAGRYALPFSAKI